MCLNCNTAVSCETCNVTRNPLVDAQFLSINEPSSRFGSRDADSTRPVVPPQFTNHAPVLHFCSTECVSTFVNDPANHGRIAWLETDKLPAEPVELTTVRTEYDAFKLALGDAKPPRERSFREYWQPRLSAHYNWVAAKEGRLRCALESHITSEERDAYRHEHGIAEGVPFAMPFPVRPGPALYVAVRSSDECFCSVSCVTRWCDERPFDAKDYWLLHGKRCHRCDSVCNQDRGDVDGILAGGLLFCTPQCVIAYFEANPKDATGSVSAEEAFESDMFEHNGCTTCHNNDPSAQYLPASAPYDSCLNDEHESHLCSLECLLVLFRKEAEHFERRALGPWYNHASPATAPTASEGEAA